MATGTLNKNQRDMIIKENEQIRRGISVLLQRG